MVIRDQYLRITIFFLNDDGVDRFETFLGSSYNILSSKVGVVEITPLSRNNSQNAKFGLNS